MQFSVISTLALVLLNHATALTQAQDIPDLPEGWSWDELSECSRKSVHGFFWRAINFTFHYPLPPLPNPYLRGIASFHLRSDLSVTRSWECWSAYPFDGDNDPLAGGDGWVTCATPHFPEDRIMFAKHSMTREQLRVWEQWTCEEEPSPSRRGYDITYTVEGSANMTAPGVTCAEATMSDYIPRLGETVVAEYMKCDSRELVVKPYSITAVRSTNRSEVVTILG